MLPTQKGVGENNNIIHTQKNQCKQKKKHPSRWLIKIMQKSLCLCTGKYNNMML